MNKNFSHGNPAALMNQETLQNPASRMGYQNKPKRRAMTDKTRELLERTAEILELLFEGPNDVDPNTLAMLGDTRLEEIRAYLAEPDVKPLSASKAYLDGLATEWRKRNTDIVTNVLWGIRFAEKHHGIGDNNENTNT